MKGRQAMLAEAAYIARTLRQPLSEVLALGASDRGRLKDVADEMNRAMSSGGDGGGR